MKKNLITLLAVFALVGTISACGPTDPSQNPEGETQATCNNDKKEGTEECDGSDFGGATCESLQDDHGQNYTGGTLSCSDQCKLVKTACTPASPACNKNDKKEGTEECDGTDLGGATCQSLTDDHGQNYTGGELSCNAQCQLVKIACTPAAPNTCDGTAVDPGEKCDGSNLNNKTCADFTDSEGQNYNGGTLRCDENCLGFNTSGCTKTTPNTCDGTAVDPGEKCDGSNLNNKTCADFTDSEGQNYNGGTLKCDENCLGFNTGGCTKTTPATCDGGALDTGEKCDGTHLNGKTCADFTNDDGHHFIGGTLACASNCLGFDTAACTSPCTGKADFFGQVVEDAALRSKLNGKSPSGRVGGVPELNGTVTTDSNLSAAQALFDNRNDPKWVLVEKQGEPLALVADISSAPISITNALVISTGHFDGFFYVQDSSGVYVVRTATGDWNNTLTVPKTGDVISFDIEKLVVYKPKKSDRTGGANQIGKVSNIHVVKENQKVPYFDVSGSMYDESKVGYLVRTYGTVMNKKSCGGYSCYDINNGVTTYVLRTKSKYVQVDQCATFMGIAGWYNGKPQLQTENYSWLFSK